MTMRKRFIPKEPVDYPSGICVKTEKGTYYIKGGKRHPFTSSRILKSWNFFYIVSGSEEAVKQFSISSPMRFRDGSLIKDMKDGRIYLISDGKKRQVTNPDFLKMMNLTGRDIMVVSHAEADLHAVGDDIV